VAAFVLPIILAAWSRRLGVFLGSLVMASAAFAAMIEPSSVALIIAVGTYLISLVLALSGIFARRRDHRMRDELRNVQSKLDDLIRAYETRLLAELKTTATPTAMAAKSRDEKTSS
jgi:ABC-type transport system involved in cytochrome bd biosynthesis fused ATPase/permease subunit